MKYSSLLFSYIYVSVVVFFLLLIFFSSFTQAVTNDWLKDAYKQSHNIMAEPYSVDAEAKDLFDTQIGIGLDGVGISDSIFVRGTRFLTRLTILLAVPMIIFAGIKIVLSFGEKEKLKTAVIEIGQVAGGIMLALLSVMIIYFVTALTRSSVDSFRFSYVVHVITS